MRKIIVLAFLGIIIGYFLPVLFAEEPKAIDFTLEDINAEKISLKDLCGKPLLLKFWATWCPVCRRDISKVNKLYDEYNKRGLLILGIDVMESKNKVSSLAKKEAVKYQVLLDLDGKVSEAYDILGVPTYFLIDKDCNINYRGHQIPERNLIENLLDSSRNI